MSDKHRFRNALGQFATGVTIVTTTDQNDHPVGVTASSFNSVSLDPPLILWSLAKSAKSMLAFEQSGGFNVHVLASHQTDLSNQFAKPLTDKFSGIDWIRCEHNRPLLNEYAALFRCKTHYKYEGGDHIIFVGEVLEYQTQDYPALVFQGGRYAEAEEKVIASGSVEPNVDLKTGQFTNEFLLYLLSRAHFQTSYPTRKASHAMGMTEPEYFCLSLLAMTDGIDDGEIASRLEHTGHQPDQAILDRLLQKKWLKKNNDNTYSIANDGRVKFIELLAESKALEEQLVKHFTENELMVTRRVLQKLIDVTGKDIPELW